MKAALQEQGEMQQQQQQWLGWPDSSSARSGTCQQLFKDVLVHIVSGQTEQGRDMACSCRSRSSSRQGRSDGQG